jgi:transmembrane sensor
MESSAQTERRAAEWLAKRDSGEWTEEDARALDAWLDASTANTVAFIRLEAVWNEAGRLQVFSSRAPLTPPAAGEWPSALLDPVMERPETPETFVPCIASHPAPARRRWLPAALAASVLLALVLAGLSYVSSHRFAYSTPVGGLASVPMSDGSKITLNTDSAIHVALSDTEREVRLDRGEAFFEVAKDPSRPFIVNAGTKRVVAVGTKFSVRREGNDIGVFVTEGKVRFEDVSTPQGEIANSAAGNVLLTAGSVAHASDTSVLVQVREIPAIEELLSWRTGYLVFHETALADAVAEFNRYNDRKIVIQDPRVASIALSGKFRSTNFEAFVRLLQDGFAIHAERTDDRIVLTE